MDEQRPGPATAGTYAIRVQGRLEQRWAGWFDGCTLTSGDDGTSVITGPVADQAALHGLLQVLRDLGLPLVSVTRADAPATAVPATAVPATAAAVPSALVRRSTP